MLSRSGCKTGRYLTPNTSHNIQQQQSSSSTDRQQVYQYSKGYEYARPSTQTYFHKDRSSLNDQDDSLTSMEWLPEVSIPYMQSVKCKISQDDIKKSMPRKRNRAFATGGKDCPVGGYRKPDYSYAMLIYKAINDTPEKRMQLFQIYEWIENHFLYYKHTPGTHWKSSIRHNLSLHKIFVKEAPPASLKSKGSFWALDKRMSDEDLLLSLQPKRPRLSRFTGGESTCINRYATVKPAYCTTAPAHVAMQSQHLFTHVRGHVPRAVHRTHAPQRTPHFARAVGRMPQHSRQDPREGRPNILSKVVRKDSSNNSSPTGSSLMNLNQLFHKNTENNSPSSSFESGYSSLNDSSQSPGGKDKLFSCSTPVKPATWNSPEFGLKSSPQLAFPLTEDGELPTLSQYMDSLNEGNISSCRDDTRTSKSVDWTGSPAYTPYQRAPSSQPVPQLNYTPPAADPSYQTSSQPNQTSSVLQQPSIRATQPSYSRQTSQPERSYPPQTSSSSPSHPQRPANSYPNQPHHASGTYPSRPAQRYRTTSGNQQPDGFPHATGDHYPKSLADIRDHPGLYARSNPPQGYPKPGGYPAPVYPKQELGPYPPNQVRLFPRKTYISRYQNVVPFNHMGVASSYTPGRSVQAGSVRCVSQGQLIEDARPRVSETLEGVNRALTTIGAEVEIPASSTDDEESEEEGSDCEEALLERSSDCEDTADESSDCEDPPMDHPTSEDAASSLEQPSRGSNSNSGDGPLPNSASELSQEVSASPVLDNSNPSALLPRREPLDRPLSTSPPRPQFSTSPPRPEFSTSPPRPEFEEDPRPPGSPPLPHLKEECVAGDEDESKSEDKASDIADLITQFINEGEMGLLNGSFSTTPLRQYLTEEESSMGLDLESPRGRNKTPTRGGVSNKTPTRRSLREEMK